MAVAPWLESTDLPERPQPADIRAFFGVPPDPEEKLDQNIARKRRHWRSKTRQQVTSDAAKRKVDQALRIIAALEQQLKRGVVEDELDVERLREEFAGEPETSVDELGDLWRVLEELLASGRLDEALRVANDARKRFEGAAAANAAFGWLAMIASRSGDSGGDALRKEGLEALVAAIDAGERSTDTYVWKAVLELDTGVPAEALATLDVAGEQLGDGPTPWMHSHRCEAHAALGEAGAALDEAKRAVDASTDDLALRSNTVTALIEAARMALLPISSDESLRSYQELIEWAAWCATGAPEAEDRVRPYRLWAVEAESRAYIGRIDLRSIIAVASGFMLLPLLNRVRSKPHWQVLYSGPRGGDDEMFKQVALAGIPLAVHAGLLDKLPWFSETDR